MTVRRQASNDTLNGQDLLALRRSASNGVDDYRLLSLRINALTTPALLEAEQVPIAVPDYVRVQRASTDSDLYFLRWVFRDLFTRLADIIHQNHKGYRILRAEVEPGIKWEDFRNDKRGLLLWLIRTRPVDDFASAPGVLPDLLQSYMDHFKTQVLTMLSLQQEELNAMFLENRVKDAAKAPEAPESELEVEDKSRRRAGDEWSVVEDDEEASSSSYDDYYSDHE